MFKQDDHQILNVTVVVCCNKWKLDQFHADDTLYLDTSLREFNLRNIRKVIFSAIFKDFQDHQRANKNKYTKHVLTITSWRHCATTSPQQR